MRENAWWVYRVLVTIVPKFVPAKVFELTVAK